jgi:hypothetical protein
MWEYILKATNKFVFEPDADWLGIYSFQDDEILINLPIVVKKIRGVYRESENYEGFNFESRVGTADEGKINSKMERALVNEILNTAEHESIHEATSDMVREVISDKAKETLKEIEEAIESGTHEGELPPLDNIENVYMMIYYSLYQEYTVRMLQGQKPKEEILRELSGYVDDTKDTMKQKIHRVMMAGIFGGELDMEEVNQVIEGVHQHIGKLEEVFLRMIFDHQSKLDGAMMQAIHNVVEGELDRVPNPEIQRRMKIATEGNVNE